MSNITIDNCPVKRMLPGDTFLSNRSGVVTVVSEPYPDPASMPFRDTWCVDVRKADGSILGLVGLHTYRVSRTD